MICGDMLTAADSNIGNDATALWKHWDDSINDKDLVLRQQLHVSILSIGSFTGRLLSGMYTRITNKWATLTHIRHGIRLPGQGTSCQPGVVPCHRSGHLLHRTDLCT